MTCVVKTSNLVNFIEESVFLRFTYFYLYASSVLYEESRETKSKTANREREG